VRQEENEKLFWLFAFAGVYYFRWPRGDGVKVGELCTSRAEQVSIHVRKTAIQNIASKSRNIKGEK
jgi:hypothetical protein